MTFISRSVNQPAGERTRGATKHSRTHLVYEACQAFFFLILLKQKKKVYFYSPKTQKNLSHPHGSGPLPDETEWHRNDGGSDEDTGEQVDPPSWLPYSTYPYLGFHFVFHDKAKRTQQGNLLRSTRGPVRSARRRSRQAKGSGWSRGCSRWSPSPWTRPRQPGRSQCIVFHKRISIEMEVAPLRLRL